MTDGCPAVRKAPYHYTGWCRCLLNLHHTSPHTCRCAARWEDHPPPPDDEDTPPLYAESVGRDDNRLYLTDRQVKAVVIAADRFGVEPWEIAVHALALRQRMALP